MDVSCLRIDIGHSYAHLFLKIGSDPVNTVLTFSSRINSPGVFFGIKEKRLTVLIYRNNVNRGLRTQRRKNIVPLVHQILHQKELARQTVYVARIHKLLLFSDKRGCPEIGTNHARHAYIKEAK